MNYNFESKNGTKVKNGDLRLYLLNKIGHELEMVCQWSRNKNIAWVENTLQHTTRATFLIELIESLDTGSIGMFTIHNPTLFDRWECVYLRYHDIAKYSGDIERIKEYFSK